MSQRVALLCPGPSLREVYCDDMFEEFEAVIAVNTAGWLFFHHWLAFLDRHVWTPVREKRLNVHLPLVGILSNNAFCDEAAPMGWKAEPMPSYYGVGVSEEAKRLTSREKMPFTMPNALEFALKRFPQARVTVFGMDYAVNQPCAGNVKGDRSVKRFSDEAIWLRSVWNEARIEVEGRASQALLDYLCRRRESWL